MSALAMILAAGMVLLGNGPEKASDEIVQGLDLSGEWEGIYEDDAGDGPRKARLFKNGRALTTAEGARPNRSVFTDERGDRLRFTLDDGSRYIGIYAQEGERIVICFARDHLRRPEDYRPAKRKQALLTLYRVKPAK